jgi:hypothetical protein
MFLLLTDDIKTFFIIPDCNDILKHVSNYSTNYVYRIIIIINKKNMYVHNDVWNLKNLRKLNKMIALKL